MISDTQTRKKQPAQKAFRLSPLGQSLLGDLAAHLGINETAVVELAIRDKARAEGFTLAVPSSSASANVPTAGESSDASGTGA